MIFLTLPFSPISSSNGRVHASLWLISWEKSNVKITGTWSWKIEINFIRYMPNGIIQEFRGGEDGWI
jgi:hypothetical protein